MGIRWERDSRRATNGPLIFFSDPSSELSFYEEIRGALISGLSFYGYRSPGETMISFGSSEGYVEGLGEPGFVIGMFDPDKPYITIPYRGIIKSQSSLQLYKLPENSTSFEEYANEVENIISDIEDGKVEKVVAARVIVKDESLDLAETFFEFCKSFPDAFVFVFSTPATGCWIGASPELLLESRDGFLNSMALAGTRDAGDERPWDEKNIREQEIVTKYICAAFEEKGLLPFTLPAFTKKAGTIEHICTQVSAELPEKEGIDLTGLLRSLSPTPALCGSPKNFAFDEIKRLENFDRGCYGGFCGPYHSEEDFRFSVGIRCASVTELRLCIYVGGGITSGSDVESEWKETEMKSDSLWAKHT